MSVARPSAGWLVRLVKLGARHSHGKSPAPPSTLASWEERVHRLARSLEPRRLTRTEQADLADVLQGALDRELLLKSSSRPIQTHFQDLFDGLQTLTAHPTRSLARLSETDRLQALANINSKQELMAAFDELYYHGELTRRTASAVLKHRARADIAQIVKLVYSGGASLYKWSVADKHTFRLQIANRCWGIGDRDRARALVIDCFDSVWAPVLMSGVLPSATTYGLGRAVVAFGRVDLLETLLSSWTASSFGELNDTSDAPANQALARVFIPLWVACMASKHYATGSLVMETAARCCSLPQDIKSASANPVLLFVAMARLIDAEIASNPEAIRSVLSQVEIGRLPFPLVDPSSDKSVSHLIDLAVTLASGGVFTPARAMASHFEAYLGHVVARTKAKDDRLSTLLAARMVLLQMVLAGHSGTTPDVSGLAALAMTSP